MKINENMHFPHPVLSEWRDDFVNGEFLVSLDIEEKPKTAQVRLKYDTEVTEPAIRELLDNGQAKVGVVVTCLETYFNRLVSLKTTGGHHDFGPGSLRGTVVMRPLVWANSDVMEFASQELHEEYADTKINYKFGDIIALGHEQVFSAGMDKLAPMETIFLLAKDKTADDGELSVDLEGERIRIKCSEKTLTEINSFRYSEQGKALLFSGVYLPALMEVLTVFGQKGTGYDGRRWYSVIEAKAMHMGLTLGQDDHLQNAQRLLDLPINKLLASGLGDDE